MKQTPRAIIHSISNGWIVEFPHHARGTESRFLKTREEVLEYLGRNL